MLEQALMALAASGGTALVAAAGTDAWGGLRQSVARWFARGDEQRERTELERLDQTAAALRSIDPAEAERAQVAQEAAWQARIETVLESLNDAERDQAAMQLRSLLAQHAPQGGVSAGEGGQAVGGNVHIEADHGSVAGWNVGDVTMGNPPRPGTPQD